MEKQKWYVEESVQGTRQNGVQISLDMLADKKGVMCATYFQIGVVFGVLVVECHYVLGLELENTRKYFLNKNQKLMKSQQYDNKTRSDLIGWGRL